MLAKVSVTLAVLSVLFMTGGIGLANAGLIPTLVGLALFVLGGLVGAAAVGTGVAIMFRSQAFGMAMISMVGALPFLVLVTSVLQAFQYPRINDITTDVADPPEFEHAQSLPANTDRDLTFPESFGPIIEEHYPKLEPLKLSLEPKRAYELAVSVAKNKMPGWTVTREDPKARTLEGTAVTSLFRWTDDFVVRVAPAEDGSMIDMRSKSREGKSDIGANARRIRQFFEAVQAAR